MRNYLFNDPFHNHLKVLLLFLNLFNSIEIPVLTNYEENIYKDIKGSTWEQERHYRRRDNSQQQWHQWWRKGDTKCKKYKGEYKGE